MSARSAGLSESRAPLDEGVGGKGGMVEVEAASGERHESEENNETGVEIAGDAVGVIERPASGEPVAVETGEAHVRKNDTESESMYIPSGEMTARNLRFFDGVWGGVAGNTGCATVPGVASAPAIKAALRTRCSMRMPGMPFDWMCDKGPMT